MGRTTGVGTPTGPLGPPAPGWLVEVPLAHRGLHVEGRLENTLAAFAAAADAGYGAELDVHLSADGVPVVVHDEDLVRVAGLDRRVADLTVEELAGVRLLDGSVGGPTLAAEIDLMRATLLLARHDNAEVEVRHYLQAFARMADDLRGDPAIGQGGGAAVRRLREYLFEQGGFHGSRHDYASRSNSYMNEVLDDRESDRRDVVSGRSAAQRDAVLEVFHELQVDTTSATTDEVVAEIMRHVARTERG